MPNKHRVIVYNWINGILHFEELIAESFEHAYRLSQECICYEAKVYDCDDILVHVEKKHHGHHKDDDDCYA